MRIVRLLPVFLAACGSSPATTPDSGVDPTPKTTWYQDAGPILAKHCTSCHQEGGIAPFSLTSYDDAVPIANHLLDEINAGVMPPFDAREEASCTPKFGWKDDPRLSADEIATLGKWVSDGTPAGTVADLPPPANTDLQGVTQTLIPATPFTAMGDRDQFMCTILDPQLAVGTWLTGLQVRPGNPTVVHHVVLTEVTPGADQDALVAAHGIGLPFNCDQMATPGAFVMSIWTPGNEPVETTEGELAIPLVAGAKVVMQIHYHPAGALNEPDATAVDLRTSNVWPKKMYFVGAFGNASQAPELLPDPDDGASGPEFTVPANKADHVEKMHFGPIDLGPDLQSVQVFSVNPHMHLLGTHIDGKLTHASDNSTECLANGLWNFDWQRTYIYDAPLDQLPTVHTGDTVDLECHWNNTVDNPFEQRLLNDANLPAPVDIHLGEQTTNEMCLEIFGLALDAPPPPSSLRALGPTKLPHIPSLDSRAR